MAHQHTQRSAPRGMTLVELLVTVAVMGIVLVGVLQSLGAFQRIHVIQSHSREASEQARLGLATIERDLRMAGYGMESGLAVDLSVFLRTNTGGNSLSYCGATEGAFAGNPCLAAGGPNSRDRQDAPDTLVYYMRNPGYWGGDTAGEPEGKAWSLVNVGAGPSFSTLTIFKHGATAPARGELIPKGQILQIVCSGADKSAYVTVDATVNEASGGDGNPLTITLAPGNAGNPFRQNAVLGNSDACLRANTARVFLIDRFRYYIEPALQLPDGTTAPFLMLDTGTDRNANGTLDAGDLIPVARGIVDLQVAYVRPQMGVINRDVMVGATLGQDLTYCSITSTGVSWKISTLGAPEACANGLGILDFNQIFTTNGVNFGYPALSYVVAKKDGAGRLSEHAANIRAVRLALVARSVTSVKSVTTFISRPPNLLNRAANPPDAEPYVYSVTDTVVPVRDVWGSRMLSYL